MWGGITITISASRSVDALFVKHKVNVPFVHLARSWKLPSPNINADPI